MVEDLLYDRVYQGERVVVTGHTGFKGSWLALWLQRLGAHVLGYALEPSTIQNHFRCIKTSINSVIGDICDINHLSRALNDFQPTIVFHLAAQSIVSQSYFAPLDTFQTNILGTANVLQVCCHLPCVRAIVVVTSDKCYENDDQDIFRSEDSRLGGDDPYSASKACAEIISKVYRQQLATRIRKDAKPIAIATARSGNVIGGGDWAAHRLIPDIVRHFYENQLLRLRHLSAIRPWQHVLNPLHGYLCLGKRLLEEGESFEGSWNFGPTDDSYVSVRQILEMIMSHGPQLTYEFEKEVSFFEHTILKLDCQKARMHLSWHPGWNLEQGINRTIEWYESYYSTGAFISAEQIQAFSDDLRRSSSDTIQQRDNVTQN